MRKLLQPRLWLAVLCAASSVGAPALQVLDAKDGVSVAAKLALKDTDAQGIADLLKGQTCLAYSEDPVSAAKVSVKYARENDKLVILGGAMGTTVMDVNAVKALADLPSLDELRAKLIGLLQAPATKIARVLKEPGAMLARVVQAQGAKSA